MTARLRCERQLSPPPAGRDAGDVAPPSSSPAGSSAGSRRCLVPARSSSSTTSGRVADCPSRPSPKPREARRSRASTTAPMHTCPSASRPPRRARRPERMSRATRTVVQYVIDNTGKQRHATGYSNTSKDRRFDAASFARSTRPRHSSSRSTAPTPSQNLVSSPDTPPFCSARLFPTFRRRRPPPPGRDRRRQRPSRRAFDAAPSPPLGTSPRIFRPTVRPTVHPG